MNAPFVHPLYLAAIATIVMSIGQILFKTGASSWGGNTPYEIAISFITNPHLIGGIFLFATNVILWIYVLKFLPLSLAYPITASSYIIVMAFSSLLFGEKITLQMIAGSCCIMAGIALVHLNID